MYKIQQIEDAILLALRSSTLQSVCRTIDTYHGEIEDLVSQVGQMTVSMPAAFVHYKGSQFTESANRSFDDEQTFAIVLIAKDLRGDKELRAGIYQMLEIVKSALIDNNLNMNIEPLHPMEIYLIATSRAFSIMGFDIKTSFSM